MKFLHKRINEGPLPFETLPFLETDATSVCEEFVVILTEQ